MFYNKYLEKRAVTFIDYTFPSIKRVYFRSIIIIPAYCESKYIIDTLDSLNEQVDFDLSSLLVLVVINNSKDDSPNVIEDNRITARLIEKKKSRYNLEYIDAFSIGNGIPGNLAGVGYSRKIGMDFALKYSYPDTILHCLDADTIVSKDYMTEITSAYKEKAAKALLVDFEHQRNQSPQLNIHIQNYEFFLKETARCIDEAGSPYGYVSLGPTITCLADTYVKVGGMVNKKATEDFYFLQKIRKFTDIIFLDKKLVFPSSRLSERVYLGTGFRMKELIRGKDVESLYYSNQSYKILKEIISRVLSLYKADEIQLNKELKNIDCSLADFFLKEGLFEVWEKINSESKSFNQFELQFHKWFDNFKTLRLLKFYS